MEISNDHLYFACLCIAATRITSTDWWFALSPEGRSPTREEEREIWKLQKIVGNEIKRMAKELFPGEV